MSEVRGRAQCDCTGYSHHVPCPCPGQTCRLCQFDPRHGTVNAYHNQECRCQPCTEAAADWNYHVRRERARQPVPEHVPHGKANTYSHWGCRCEACRRAHSKRRAISRAKYVPGCNCAGEHVRCPCEGSRCRLCAGDSRHGTLNGYGNMYCRCSACRTAGSQSTIRYRKRRAELEVPEHLHGTANAYTNWSCRCDACRAAHIAERLAQRKRRNQ